MGTEPQASDERFKNFLRYGSSEYYVTDSELFSRELESFLFTLLLVAGSLYLLYR